MPLTAQRLQVGSVPEQRLLAAWQSVQALGTLRLLRVRVGMRETGEAESVARRKEHS